MNEETQLKAFVAFLVVFSLMALAHPVLAAINVSPTVPGYSAASGGYRAPAGSFTMAPANAGYIQPAVANVGGKPITVPAKMRMAANAGQFAKNAMRLNPWGLAATAATLAAGYLADNMMSWDNDTNTWRVPDGWSSPYAAGFPVYGIQGATCINAHSSATPDMQVCYGLAGSGWANSGVGGCPAIPCPDGTCDGGGNWEQDYMSKWVEKNPFPSGCVATSPGSRPATDDDWAALPDPLPAVAPELPYAPYMPEGVPVEAPEYDFAPFNTPLGQPYTKPDGSTSQPMASVSPNGDSITVDTFDQPLTDSAGNPVPNPQPQDTAEPAPEQKTDCDKYPTSVGCTDLGTPASPEPVPTTELPVNATVTPIGGSGACPSPASLSFLGQPLTWSYQPICDFAGMIRPLVIGFAWLTFGLIVVGAIRK